MTGQPPDPVGEVDAVSLEDFLWWMHERQEIYRRRFVEGEDPPWTEDEILQTRHFCHVYRELDRGTRYLKSRIVGCGPPEDVFFNVVVYRLFNRPDTFDALGGFTAYNAFDPDLVVEALDEFGKNNNIFSSAYRVSSHPWAGADNKVENLVYGVLRDDLLANFSSYWDSLECAETAEETHEVLSGINGVGDFLGYEIYTDLTYTDWFPFGENDFVNIGPGAAAAVETIFGDVDTEYIDWLVESQEKLFRWADHEFYHWNGEGWKRLTKRDFEHSLCEWRKYQSVKKGRGSVRRYQYEESEQQSLEDF